MGTKRKGTAAIGGRTGRLYKGYFDPVLFRKFERLAHGNGRDVVAELHLAMAVRLDNPNAVPNKVPTRLLKK